MLKFLKKNRLNVLVVGTGRDGTVSLTRWFNDLFESNKFKGQAAHEYLASECYQAFEDHVISQSDAPLKSIVARCVKSDFDVIVGNGYASLLPYFASLNNNIFLIHLQRKDRDAWLKSTIKNAKFYPTSFKHYTSDTGTPRTTAFHTSETTEETWRAWSLEEKLNWYYDYTHTTIEKYEHLFPNNMHIYTENLTDANALHNVAKFCYPNLPKIPSASKLNSHYFADIDSYPERLRPLAQWLLGNLDWQKAVADPAYFVSYAMNRFETIVGWNESGKINEIFPDQAISSSELSSILKSTLPNLKRSIALLEAALSSSQITNRCN